MLGLNREILNEPIFNESIGQWRVKHPLDSNLKVSIGISTMPDPKNLYCALRLVQVVQNPVVANLQAVQVRKTFQLFETSRKGGSLQKLNPLKDSGSERLGYV